MSDKTPWTKGPWYVPDEPQDHWKLDTGCPLQSISAGGMVVAFVPTINNTKHLSDCRLIAAAPEMAELLRAAAIYLNESHYGLGKQITEFLSRIGAANE